LGIARTCFAIFVQYSLEALNRSSGYVVSKTVGQFGGSQVLHQPQQVVALARVHSFGLRNMTAVDLQSDSFFNLKDEGEKNVQSVQI
jgi:hypothetical protein